MVVLLKYVTLAVRRLGDLLAGAARDSAIVLGLVGIVGLVCLSAESA